MKPLQLLFVAGIALAVMGAAAKLLALLLVMGTLAAFVTRPREVIGLVATIGLLNLFAIHPITLVILVGGLVVARVVPNRGASQTTAQQQQISHDADSPTD